MTETPQDKYPGGGGLVLGQLLNRVNMGGAENYAVLISSFHGDLGRNSQVLVLKEPGPLSGRFSKSVTVNYLGFNRQSIRNPFKFIYSLFEGYKTISRAIDEQGIDLLQTHLQEGDLWGLVMALTNRCKVIVTVHSNQFLDPNDGTAVGGFFKYHAYRLIVTQCSALVTVSEEVRCSLLEKLKISEKHEGKLIAVNNGVMVPELFSDHEKDQIRRKFLIEDGQTWLVAVGRFNKVKNFQVLIQMAALLQDRGSNFRLLIAGDGELREDFEALRSELGLEDLVHMPGNLDNISDILRSADILMMPSLWEGLPLVLLEGMACGLAAIGSRTKGIADIMVDLENGLLAEVGNVEEFANSVEVLINDPDKRREMGNRGRELVLEKYSLQRTYRDLCKVYEKAMTEQG